MLAIGKVILRTLRISKAVLLVLVEGRTPLIKLGRLNNRQATCWKGNLAPIERSYGSGSLNHGPQW